MLWGVALFARPAEVDVLARGLRWLLIASGSRQLLNLIDKVSAGRR
jgi:hypothetical protein